MVARCCVEFGMPLASVGTKLAGGRSGSLVVSVSRGSTSAVLKVTSTPHLIAGAKKEVRLLAATTDQFGDVLPKVITSAEGPGWVAVLLRMYDQAPPATLLSADEWVAIAAALSSIHRQPVAPVSGLGPREPLTGDEVDVAMGHWDEVGAGREARRGAEMLDRCADVALRALATVLTHGDCHTENIVRDASGRYRWIDWQQACLGDGIDDLVFIWQRAEFAGASPPRRAMLAAYADARALQPFVLKPLCERAELRLLLHSWGSYLSYGSPGGRDLMRRRLYTVTSR